MLHKPYPFLTRNKKINTFRKGYSNKRLLLHSKIIKKVSSQCKNNNSPDFPVAILVGGGSASGKTLLRNTIIMDEVTKRGINSCIVDADNIKEEIPEYHIYLKDEPSFAATYVHKESVDIRNKVLQILIKNESSFIYEGTMTKLNDYQKLVKNLKEKNYIIEIWIADIPFDIALKRAKKREKETGRKVPYQVIKNTHKMIPKTFRAIKGYADEYYIFDNQNEYQMIYSKDYIDKKRYIAFVKKEKI